MFFHVNVHYVSCWIKIGIGIGIGSSKEPEKDFAEVNLDSGMLVVEDEEFFLSFIFAESSSLFPHQSDSVLLDSLLFSSSLAAVGGAIFMKKLSLLAAALPIAFRTVFGLRTGAQLIRRRQACKLKYKLCCLISSMKKVKTVLSKSLNVIRGMEIMNNGYLVAVKSGHQESGSSTLESKLSKALYVKTLLIPLRQSIYSESLHIILALRQVHCCVS